MSRKGDELSRAPSKTYGTIQISLPIHRLTHIEIRGLSPIIKELSHTDEAQCIINYIKVMKKPSVFIGIDISKLTLDICIVKDKETSYQQIDNHRKAIDRLITGFDEKNTVIAMENTGRYNWALYEALADKQYSVYVIPPLHLKQSLGLTRGKNDQVDAYRIACFIQKHYQEVPQWDQESTTMMQLKVLLAERKMLVRHKSAMIKNKKELYLIRDTDFRQKAEDRLQHRINQLNTDIQAVEKEIKGLIADDHQLKEQAELLESIPGVGKVLCWNLITKTNGFQKINEPRKLACYAGVVPFDHQSGTSVKRRAAVSNFADKQLKTALHMSAMVASRVDPELKTYYQRKVQEGKNKMAVLNAIRNKLIHRVCSVIKRGTPYEIRLDLS